MRRSKRQLGTREGSMGFYPGLTADWSFGGNLMLGSDPLSHARKSARPRTPCRTSMTW